MKKKGEYLVSVIVPAYNSGKYISKCLDSILSQTYGNIEVIVVYSPSNDNTLEKIMEYYGRITLIKSPIRLVPSKARNIGIQQARGYYLAFCDADDYWSPDKIEVQLKAHLKDPEIGLTYTDLVKVSDDGHLIRKSKTPEWDSKRKLFLKQRVGISISSAMITRSSLEAAGLFDEDPRFYGVEDFDLYIRLSQLTKFRRIRGYYTFYRISTGGITSNKLWRVIARGNVYKKHHMTKLYLENFLMVTFDFFVYVKEEFVMERLRTSTSLSFKERLKRILHPAPYTS